jgi:hypothetical protein
MALFTEDARFVVYMDTKSDIPSHELQGRDALAPAFHNLNQYDATTHFNGQNTVGLDGPEATGVSYCLAHHVSVHGSGRRLMIASIRYLDRFTKRDGVWCFAERQLLVDWIETRRSSHRGSPHKHVMSLCGVPLRSAESDYCRGNQAAVRFEEESPMPFVVITSSFIGLLLSPT